jgi:hypothetical protein
MRSHNPARGLRKDRPAKKWDKRDNVSHPTLTGEILILEKIV